MFLFIVFYFTLVFGHFGAKFFSFSLSSDVFFHPPTLRTPFPIMLYSLILSHHKLKKTIHRHSVLGRKQTLSNQISECFCVVRVYISICRLVHQKFWSIGPILMKSHVFWFVFFLVFKESEPSSSGLSGTNSLSVLCVQGRKQNVSAEKKSLKKKQKAEKKE